MAISKFTNRSTTYKCECCGKQTRDTGEGECDGARLCAACYWDGQIDILQWDNEFPAELLRSWLIRRDALNPNTPHADTQGLRAICAEMWKHLNP